MPICCRQVKDLSVHGLQEGPVLRNSHVETRGTRTRQLQDIPSVTTSLSPAPPKPCTIESGLAIPIANMNHNVPVLPVDSKVRLVCTQQMPPGAGGSRSITPRPKILGSQGPGFVGLVWVLKEPGPSKTRERWLHGSACHFFGIYNF